MTTTFDAEAFAESLTADLDDGPMGPEEEPGGFDQAVTDLIAEMLDTDGLDDIPAMQPLIDGFLYRDTLARLIGPSGHMKSFVALDMAAHVATGRPWRDHKVDQGTAIYLVAEGAGGIRKRVRAWEQHHGSRMVGVKFLPRPVQAGDALAWSILTEACRRLEPSLIIFDTQARITVGVEENSSKEMGIVVARMDNLRSVTKACCALVHHQGHNGEHGRGSTSVKGAMQSEIRVTKKGKKGSDARIVVSSDKQKDDEELDDVVFAIEVVKIDGMAKEDGSPITSVVLIPAEAIECEPDETKRPPATRKILEALEDATGPLTAAAIVDWIAEKHGHGLRRETVSKALNSLAGEGVVDRTEESAGGPAYWRLSPSPEDV